ncbi:MAG: triose-phosphate isomerase [Parachlamydiales bacterium]|nr:triose-phosphate isomerase [Parachlamydiales bacterium]
MSRRPIVAGNWKMYKTTTEAVAFIDELAKLVGKDDDVAIYLAVPFTLIKPCSESAKGSSIVIGAQNMHDATEGAFTGEVAGSMLLDAGAKFVILGHSERRNIFKETNAFIHKKVQRALELKLHPILCIGETLEERNDEQTHSVLQEQLSECLKGASVDAINNNLTIAYEPVWAIGTGQVATPEMADDAHRFCRDWLRQNFNEDIAQNVRIIYGGSVNSSNCNGLFQKGDIDGALVGGASLQADKFYQIVESAKQRGSVV